VSGPGASNTKGTDIGVKAGIVAAKRMGCDIKLTSIADTQTNPGAVLPAARKLVQQDKVFAVLAGSALVFEAAPFLQQHGVPVLGVAQDGPEWLHDQNMFSADGAFDTTKVFNTFAKFLQMQGVTTVGALGYSISPTSAEAAKGLIAAAKTLGLKEGYLNAKFPFGSTNVQPVALGMKNAGVDGLSTATSPNTAFALYSALHNLGSKPVMLLAIGYGSDILQAGPGALQAAQNVYFALPYQPVEMQTAATKQFQSDLAAVGMTGEPNFAMYNGYATVLLLAEGLKKAGANPTQAALIRGLQGVQQFNDGGLYGDKSIDPNDRSGNTQGPGNCVWVTKLTGNTLAVVKGADPICGEIVPGTRVSP
jgi:branched-chain amino acid transport system substrate-binding protein